MHTLYMGVWKVFVLVKTLNWHNHSSSDSVDDVLHVMSMEMYLIV